MTFDITKVCYKPNEELLGQEVYFAQYLQTLEERVTEENDTYKGYITRLDEEGSYMPFCIGKGIWANFIYLTGKKKETVSPKYRPFNDTNEFIAEYEKRIGNNKNPPCTMPLIWVKYKASKTVGLITAFCKDGVEMGGTYMTWGYFLDAMVFLDNSPCGVEIKEEVV